MKRLVITSLVLTGAALLIFSVVEIVSRKGALAWIASVFQRDIPLAIACFSVAILISNNRGRIRKLVQIMAALALPLALLNIATDLYRSVSAYRQISLLLPINPHQYANQLLTGLATCVLLLIAFIPSRAPLKPNMESFS